MKKVLAIVGARPQFIKHSVVELALQKCFDVATIHTGQHYDDNMSAVFFQQMNIPKPQYHLSVGNLNHGAMTGRMTEEIEKIIIADRPDMLVVYGDTNSTLAGALAAVKLHVPVIHIEAGLRSFNRQMPEEINRVLTDHVSDILFCPTAQAIENLKNEGVFSRKGVKTILTGDVMLDSSLLFAGYAKAPAFSVPPEFILVTMHRAENTDDVSKLKEIIAALNQLNKEIPVLMPIHPRTAKLIEKERIETTFQIVEPVGYMEMLYLLQCTSLVVTDSGGLQKEAYFFRKPCVTVRDQTEWIELVNTGVNILANTDKADILTKVDKMLNTKMDFATQLYGDGKAAEFIAETLHGFNRS
ncbi:UDP-GlcNAc3NAcA epimerase [Chitinophaga sp. CF118]|uniref:non-hydrolyzing UDP-N-acetylglucosamine 2-epimerase n=1 Tax=Chitinophaga sp. CF118 TaxID=1884367 RepID=UPI0008E68F2A|nr:UDP-N-acetylglucosamine 2-epimerase (non-hydrolyzing) [Chitinophaga sp. CF118]SFD80672.1 UDP-GlcNAc3NAcA epimerase [Chitinophaga sp. CF118]